MFKRFVLLSAVSVLFASAAGAQQFDDHVYGPDEDAHYGARAPDGVAAARSALAEAEASRRALERALMEIMTLRRELEAARAEIDRLRGGATAPVSVEAMRGPVSAPGSRAVTRRNVRTHTVSLGETLGTISQRYYGTPSRYLEIFEANRDAISNPDMIYEGQVITIP